MSPRNTVRSGLAILSLALAFALIKTRIHLSQHRADLVAATPPVREAAARADRSSPPRKPGIKAGHAQQDPHSQRLLRICALLLADLHKLPRIDPVKANSGNRVTGFGGGWSPNLAKKNPEYAKAALVTLRYDFETRYAPLLQKLAARGIDPNLLIDHLLAQQMIQFGITLDPANPAAPFLNEGIAGAMPWEKAQAIVDAQLRSSLPADAYSDYENYKQELAGFDLADRLQALLSYAASPLSTSAYEALARLAAMRDGRSQLEDTVDSGFIAQAQDFLSAEQVAELRTIVNVRDRPS